MKFSNQVTLTYEQGRLTNDLGEIPLSKGLYAFIVEVDNSNIILYVGKSVGDDRLRQHLTGNNKDGTKLSESVSTKYNNIMSAINEGRTVKLSVYQNQDFTMASLAGLEIACIEKAKKDLQGLQCGIESWNERIG